MIRVILSTEQKLEIEQKDHIIKLDRAEFLQHIIGQSKKEAFALLAKDSFG